MAGHDPAYPTLFFHPRMAEDLLRRRDVLPDGRLPPALPFVAYNAGD